jgi:hypothetical protein
VVGFYLVNLGFVALFMRSGHVIDNPAYAMEVLAAKIGWVLLVLGGMHFFNLYIFARLRRRSGVNHEDNRERSSGGMLSPAAVTARLASERLSAEKLAEPAGA